MPMQKIIGSLLLVLSSFDDANLAKRLALMITVSSEFSVIVFSEFELFISSLNV
jgi:hypothetical protein